MHGRDTFRGKALPLRRMNDPIPHEFGESLLFKVLKLASATARKMPARRRRVVLSGHKSAVRQHDISRRRQRNMTPGRRHPVALGGDSQNGFFFAHRQRR